VPVPPLRLVESPPVARDVAEEFVHVGRVECIVVVAEEALVQLDGVVHETRLLECPGLAPQVLGP
jgi:hypothetical protein